MNALQSMITLISVTVLLKLVVLKLVVHGHIPQHIISQIVWDLHVCTQQILVQCGG